MDALDRKNVSLIGQNDGCLLFLLPKGPIHSKSVALLDVMISLQRQRIQIKPHNLIRRSHHLTLRNPQRRLRHRTGKIIDLNPIELVDGNLDRIHHLTNHAVTTINDTESLVLQPSETSIRLRQEITRPARRIKELKPGNLLLESNSPLPLELSHGSGTDIGQLSLKIIQEQRINHLVNILNAGIVHAAGTASLRIKSRLKHGSKDSRTDDTPVKVIAGALKK